MNTKALSCLSSLALIVGSSGCGDRSANRAPKADESSQPASLEPTLTLVREGVPKATIVLSAAPSRAAVFAVRELNEHIQKITGTALPVVAEANAVSGPRILVGESEATKAMGLRGADFGSQEFTVQFGPETIVLLGRDQLDRRANQPAWVEGKWGRAMEFDRGQFLYIPESGFDDREGMIEVWIYVPKEGFVDDGTIVRLQGRDNNGLDPVSYHLLQTLANNSIAYSSVTPGGPRALTISAPLTEGWHFVRTTHSAAAGNITLSVDGIRYAAANYTPTALAGAAMSVGGMTRTTGRNNQPSVTVCAVGLTACVFQARCENQRTLGKHSHWPLTRTPPCWSISTKAVGRPKMPARSSA